MIFWLAMGKRRDGRLFVLIICVFTSLSIEDPAAHCHVDAANHGHSGPGGRSIHLPNSQKGLGERRGPTQEQQYPLKPPPGFGWSVSTPQAYRSNAEFLAAIREYASRCSHISRLYTIGKSVRGVSLMVLEISDFPGQFEPEPAFKYVGNMHGDEPSGRELSLYLAEWLCANYLNDPLATLIVQNVHLHLLPSMNPDGFESRSRNNANDVDLNRDFPDQFFAVNNDESGRQPETKAIMQWVRNTQFTASASLHEGALVASYGWDGTLTGRTGYAASPDDAGFRYMASLYAQFNPLMKENPEFTGGVTNGAAWYPLYGGMQDWNYIYGNCFEITLEMNDAKWPNITEIPKLWNQHRESLLELVASLVKSGVHGKVISSADGRPLPATISVKGKGNPINASSRFGDYHRILPPGKIYELTAKMPGYVSRRTTIVLSKNKAITLDFILDPVPTSEVFLQAHPRLRGFRRTPISSEVFDRGEQEVVKVPCADSGLARLQQSEQFDQRIDPSWLTRKYIKSLDHPEMTLEVMMEQLTVISSCATVILVAVVLFVLVRWGRSLRPQPVRNLLRKT